MSKLILGVRFIMAFSFMVLAFVMVYYREYTGLSPIQTTAFSVLLCVYGIFRLYRAYKRSDDVFIEN